MNSHVKHRNVCRGLCWGKAANAGNESFLDGPFHYKSVIWLVVKYSVVQKKSQGKRKLVFWAVGGLVCCFDFFYFFFCCSGAALLILLKCSP